MRYGSRNTQSCKRESTMSSGDQPITKETQMESTPTPRSSVSPPKANDKAPKILDLPIGLDATGMRREFDSLGDVEVPADHYWGAQTQRSLQHFNIGQDRMPKEVYHAYGYVKKAAAIVNTAAGRLQAWKGELIQRVCDEVISGALDTEFPPGSTAWPGCSPGKRPASTARSRRRRGWLNRALGRDDFRSHSAP